MQTLATLCAGRLDSPDRQSLSKTPSGRIRSLFVGQLSAIYQHATAEADQAIADALDKRIAGAAKPAPVSAEDGQGQDDDGTAGALARTG